MAKCVFTERCVGYIHGAKDEMSCDLISEARIATSTNNTKVKVDVAKLNESKQRIIKSMSKFILYFYDYSHTFIDDF